MDFAAFGSLLIAQDLVEDRFGTLSRAWARDQAGDIRPIFLRRFVPALCTPAVTDALQRTMERMELPASCGTGHQFGRDPVPHWKLNHQMSRSLRRIQEQCRAEAFPLEPALALHVAWVLANVCARFWRQGLSVGSLSLDAIRIDFEGSLFLPDLGWMPTLIRLADRDPALRSALPELPRGPVAGELGEEARRFGTFLYELITFETLPAGLPPAKALKVAKFWTPEGPADLPPQVRLGLARLLGGEEPFETLEGALKTFEQLVFEDEDGPSTFNLAHLMHTLFRQDYESQRERLEQELGALTNNEAWQHPASGPSQVPPSPRKGNRQLVTTALIAAACVGLGSILFLEKHDRPAQEPEPRLTPVASPRLSQPVVAAPPAPKPPVPKEVTPPPRKELEAKLLPPPKPAATRLPSIGPGTPDRPPQVQALTRFPWPQGEPRSTVVIRVFVHEDGHPLRATAVPGSTAGQKVVQEAMDAAMRGRYLPAVRDGAAVRDWVEVSFKP